MAEEVHVGGCVIYHDSKGEPHDALVTCVFGDHVGSSDMQPVINLVFVSGDFNLVDSYGRQIERVTSIPHGGHHPVHGKYWRFESETPNPVATPTEKWHMKSGEEELDAD